MQRREFITLLAQYPRKPPINVRFRGNSGHQEFSMMSAKDPKGPFSHSALKKVAEMPTRLDS